MSTFLFSLAVAAASTANANKPAAPSPEAVAASRTAVQGYVNLTHTLAGALRSLPSTNVAQALHQHGRTQQRKGFLPDHTVPIAKHGKLEFQLNHGLTVRDTRVEGSAFREVVPHDLIESGMFTEAALHGMMNAALAHSAGVPVHDAPTTEVAIHTIHAREQDAQALERLVNTPGEHADIKLLHSLCEACTVNRLPEKPIHLATKDGRTLEVIYDSSRGSLALAVKNSTGGLEIRPGRVTLKEVVSFGIETKADFENAVGNQLAQHAPEDFPRAPAQK